MVAKMTVLIGLVLLGICDRATLAQIPPNEDWPSIDQCVRIIRQFSVLHNGLKLQGSGTGTQKSDNELRIESSFQFQIGTNADGSYRHFEMTEEMNLHSQERKTTHRLEGLFDRGYGVLNARHWGKDGKNTHQQLNGFLKTYRTGNIQMLWLSYGLGISYLDQDSIDIYFPESSTPHMAIGVDDTAILVSEVPGLGKCTVQFGADQRITGYSIEKDKLDSCMPLKTVGERRIKQDEYYASIRTEVTGIRYGKNWVSGFKVSEVVLGAAGSRNDAECEFSMEAAGSFVTETDKPPGLTLVKELSDQSVTVVIYDDPNVRYVPDKTGRVSKVVDRRGFDTDKSGTRGFGNDKEDSSSNEEDDNEVVFECYLRSRTPAGHCGVYCLANAFQEMGVAFRIQDLLDSKYISRFEGSSQKDLILACKNYGVEAVDVANLPLSTLRNLDSPVLLLLDQDPSRMNH